MSGANQLPKFARVNREEQLVLSTVGPTFGQRVQNTVTSNVLTAAQVTTDLLFNNAGLTPFSGPTAVQVLNYLQATYPNWNPTALNERFTVYYRNTTATPMVINMGAGFSPAQITIPANSTQAISWEHTSLSPQTFTLFSQLSTTAAAVVPIPSPANNDDLLVWDTPSNSWTTTSLHTRGRLDIVRTGSNLIPHQVEAWMSVNPTLIPFGGAGNVFLIQAAAYTAVNQFVAQWISRYTGLASNPAVANDAILLLTYPQAGFIPSNVPNTDVIYHIRCFSVNGNPTNEVFRVDASGFVYTPGVIIISDQELKKDVEPVMFDSTLLETMSCKKYHFLEQQTEDPMTIGLVAQDFENVFPGVYVPRQDDKRPASINQCSFNGFVVSALRDLALRLKDAEARITTLENA